MKTKKFFNFLSIFICFSIILLSCYYTDNANFKYYNQTLSNQTKVSAQDVTPSTVSSTATGAATALPVATTASATTIPTTGPAATTPAAASAVPSPTSSFGTDTSAAPVPTSPTGTGTSAPIPIRTSSPRPTNPITTLLPPSTPRPIIIPTANPQQLVSITVTYTGPTITAPTTITKNNLVVTAHYSNQRTAVISDYTFLSSTEITTPGNYTITVFYSGLKASCYILYDDGTLPSTYTITLESNGGSSLPAITNIAPNSTIYYPSTPVFYGYRFRGWYTSPDFTTEFSEYDRITSNMTLYAKWEKKENPDRDTFTNYITFDNYTVVISADLTGQTLSRYINLNTKPIDSALISELCKNVCSTSKYFGFSLGLTGYAFSPADPPLITISIPSTFDTAKTAVYYTTNHKTIAGIVYGIFTSDTMDGQNYFTFYAYEPGTYILAETDTIQPTIPPTAAPTATPTIVPTTTPTIAPPTPTPYITMSSIGKVTIHSQVAPNVKLYHSSKNISDINLIWSSSNTSVASVSKNGVVNAQSIGTATITVRSEDGTLSASRKITVTTKKPIKTLTLNVSKKTLRKGKSFQIKATIRPAKATIKTLSYKSSKPSVAKVSKTGKITAKKKGTCVITVKTTDGSGISKKINITVKK